MERAEMGLDSQGCWWLGAAGGGGGVGGGLVRLGGW